MGNYKTQEELAEERQLLRDAVSLEDWTEFVRRDDIPLDLRPALSARRPDMISLARRRPLTADETDKVYKLLVMLFRTNEALRAHTKELARMVNDWTQAMNSVKFHADAIADFASFKRGGLR
ncbi:MAG: hypothetical protein EHM35_19930 [Planctomycetaceae bacterium]|nr:MAG: hypothetical protein EHM35_19930 [Planctomycetaceae bacterium]